MESSRLPEVIRFGPYQIRPRTQEFFKNGLRKRLIPQAFQILLMLLQRPGELVTREELQQERWASDTFVDFEHGLNSAINKLREALGDNTDRPSYIETLPRLGYRFVGAIAQPTADQITIAPDEKREGLTGKASRRKWWIVGLGFAGLSVLFAVGFYGINSSARSARVVKYLPLTLDRRRKGPAPCGGWSNLVTDGLRVFFSEPSSSVAEVSATGGEVVKHTSPIPCFFFSDISPDKTELLGASKTNGARDQPIWSLSIASGVPHRLGNLIGHSAAWSRDGERIAYATGDNFSGPTDVFIALKDGSEQKKVFSIEEGFVYLIQWSPNGSFLRVAAAERATCSLSLWEVSVDGSNPHRITLFPGENRAVCNVTWTPDGRYSLLTVPRVDSLGIDLWVVREKQPSLLGRTARPVQLTTGGTSFWDATTSPDGKRIFAIGGEHRGELMRYDLKSKRLEPFLSGISADHLDFSQDRKWLTYLTFPDGILWRSRVDGSDRMQLTTAPLEVGLPRWSPDGTRIAFTGRLPGKRFRIYVISAEGGKPEAISPGQIEEVDPTWRPDGNVLIFGGSSVSPESTVSSVDLRTGRVTVIPGSKGMYTPRISPDGRFIVAMDAPGSHKLLLFDEHTQKWSELMNSREINPEMNPGWPQWSGDNRYVYFKAEMPPEQGFSVYRVGVADHKVERVAKVEVPEGMTGLWGPWFGLAPDGSPLVLRDLSIQEIYALDVELP